MSQQQPNRRNFLKMATAAVPLLATAPLAPEVTGIAALYPNQKGPLRLSCNLYSFNESMLVTKIMTLEQVFQFCAELGFDAVDPTGYYFPGYPAVPADSYIYDLKRKAFRMGLDISGTGVRNDFTLADPTKRKAEIDLVRQWVTVAAKLGAPCLRVFAGKGVPPGYTRPEVVNWMVDAVGQCAEYGAKQGVTIVFQNHADFIETADQLLEILDKVNSDWLAVNLDVGSFKIGDPYAQIAKVAPRAGTWQIKENLFVDGKEVETDLTKIMRIVRESGYKGYLPIETLGKGDPRQKVPAFYNKVKKALDAL